MRAARFLESACLFFAALGLWLAFAGDSGLFAAWRSAAAAALFGSPTLPASLGPMLPVSLGILGGSIAGKWVAAWFLVRGPLRRGERWAEAALWAGLGSWFFLDSAVSLARGFALNVALINTLPLLLLGAGLGWWRRTAPPPPPRPPRAPARPVFWVCVAYALVGVVVALAPAPLVGLWNRGVWPTPPSPAALTWQAFVFGPIGATFCGHFVMLTFMAHFAAAERWAGRAIVGSVLTWFLVDSATGLWLGATFNVVAVNLPCLLVVLGAWAAGRPR